jgi:hypothetical protein
VRQGDPLSPLLFVLAADLLQAILNKALHQGNLQALINCPPCPDFPIIQYADDTLVVMQANARQLICLKAILHSFAMSTGLKVNYHKSSMIPINMDGDRLAHFANTLCCQIGGFPFTYLGLPLSLTKPNLDSFMPMVGKVQKRLGGIANFLNYGGQLELVKSILTSISIFQMCCLDIPITITEQIVKYMRHYLWRKKDSEVQAKGTALIA